MTDPVTAAKAVKVGHAGFKFWRKHELGKKLTRALFPKIMARRDARRAEKTGQAVPVELGEGMNEQIASVLRTVIKSAGGSLVGAGIVTDGQMEILAGAAAIIIGMVWSWWVKRKAPATAG